MAGPFVKFDADQARRIVRTVRKSEGDVQDERSGRPFEAGDRRIPNLAFAVKCTIDGGSAGSGGADCSWTYTVTTLSGRALGTALTPTKAQRIPMTQYAVTPDGSIGAAYFDETGALQLWDVGEVPETEDCPSETLDFILLKSPDGTVYKLSIGNDGAPHVELP